MVTAESSDPFLNSPQHPDDGHQDAAPASPTPGEPQDAPETLHDAPAATNAPGSPPHDGAAGEMAGDEAATTENAQATDGSGFKSAQGNDHAATGMQQPSIDVHAFTAFLQAAMAPLMAEIVQLRQGLHETEGAASSLHDATMKAVGDLNSRFSDIEKVFTTSPTFRGQHFKDASALDAADASTVIDLTTRRLDDQFASASTPPSTGLRDSSTPEEIAVKTANVETPKPDARTAQSASASSPVIIDQSDLSAIIKQTAELASTGGGGASKQLALMPKPFSGKEEDFKEFRTSVEHCAAINDLGYILNLEGKHCNAQEHAEALEVFRKRSTLSTDGQSRAQRDQTRAYIMIANTLHSSDYSLRSVAKPHDKLAGTLIYDALLSKHLPKNAQLLRRKRKEFEALCYTALSEDWTARWEKVQDYLRVLHSLDYSPDEKEAVEILVDAMRQSPHDHWRNFACTLEVTHQVPTTLHEFNALSREQQLNWSGMGKKNVANVAEKPGTNDRSKNGKGKHSTSERKSKKKADGQQGKKKDSESQGGDKYCTKHGHGRHTTAECKALQKEKEEGGGEPTGKQQKNDEDLRDYTCFRCGEQGHIRTNCPKKKEGANVVEIASCAEALPKPSIQVVPTPTIETKDNCVTWESPTIPDQRIKQINKEFKEGTDDWYDAFSFAEAEATSHALDYFKALKTAHEGGELTSGSTTYEPAAVFLSIQRSICCNPHLSHAEVCDALEREEVEAFARVWDYYVELRDAHDGKHEGKRNGQDDDDVGRNDGDDKDGDRSVREHDDDDYEDRLRRLANRILGIEPQRQQGKTSPVPQQAFMTRVIADDGDEGLPAAEYIVMLVDSGCTISIVRDIDHLEDYAADRTTIQTASNKNGSLKSAGAGMLALTFPSSEGDVQVRVPALHCPNARRPLLSVSSLIDLGWTCSFNGNSALTSPEGHVVYLDRDIHEGSTALWTLRGRMAEPVVQHYALTAHSASAALTPAQLWHLRLGHINHHDLSRGCARLKNGPKDPLVAPTDDIACHDCARSKMRRTGPGHLGVDDSDVTLPLALLHLDLSGPMRKTSAMGSRYSLIVVDSHTHYKWELPLKKKSDVADTLRQLIVRLHATTKYTVKRVHSDQGTEFTSAAFGAVCNEFNIAASTSIAYEPRQNPVAERCIQTLTTLARTMLLTSNAPLHLWQHARIYAAEVTNAIAMGDRQYSPHEMLFQQQADASLLYPWGCWVQVYHPRRLLPDSKFSTPGEEGIYIGTASHAQQRGFAVYLRSGRVTTAVSIRIDQSFFPYRARGTQRLTATYFHEDESPDTHATWPGVDAPLLNAERVFIPPHDVDDGDASDPANSTDWTNDGPNGNNGNNGVDDPDPWDARVSLLDTFGRATPASPQGGINSMAAPYEWSNRTEELAPPRGDDRNNDRYNGEDFATDFIARHVELDFEGKVYKGQVIDVTSDAGITLYQVKYDNADKKKWCDIFTYDELKDILLPAEQHEANTLDVEMSSDLIVDATNLGNDVIPTRTLMLLQPDADKFIEAEHVENENMTHHRVWRWSVLPKGKKCIPLKYTYKRKRNQHGKIVKYKARLVAKGFRQVHGIDFFDTAAPVATIAAFRILLAVAVTRDLTLEVFDVDGAFLNSEIEEEVYVTPPPGMKPPEDFVASNPSGSYALRLQKTLYGLKQSARAWHNLFKSVLVQMGYIAFDGSDCAYVLHEGNSTSMLVIHVDDVAHAHNSERLSKRLKDRLKELWGLSGCGPLEYFLGMQVVYIKGRSAHVSQQAYLEGVLRRFDMLDAHPKGTPMDTALRISKNAPADAHGQSAIAKEKIKKEYQQMLGSLLFAAIMTRLDIANACSQLGRVMSDPNEDNLAALKRVMRYIKGTIDLGIKFENKEWTPPGAAKPISPLTPVAYSDSDWASNHDDRTSTSGFVVMLAGAPISWKSKKQNIQALSSAEAEYIALAAAAKEVTYAKNVLSELGIADVEDTATRIYCDNTAAISLANNAGVTDKTKHIQLRHHYLRTLVADGSVAIEKVGTEKNLADPFTKALPKDAFQRHRSELMKSA